MGTGNVVCSSRTCDVCALCWKRGEQQGRALPTAVGSELSGVTKHWARDGDTQRRAPRWGPQEHWGADPRLLLRLSPRSCPEEEPLGRRVAGRLRQPLAVSLRSERTPSSHPFPNLALGLQEPRDSLLQSPHRCRRPAALFGGRGLAVSSSPPQRGQERSSSRGDHMCPWVLPCGFWGTESPRGEKPGLMTWSGSRAPCTSSPVTYRCLRKGGAGTGAVVCGLRGTGGNRQVSPASPSLLGFSSVFPHAGRASGPWGRSPRYRLSPRGTPPCSGPVDKTVEHTGRARSASVPGRL